MSSARGAFLEPGLIGSGEAEEGASVRLAAAHCPNCRRVTFPPLSTCPACGAGAVAVELPAEGRLRGFTSVLHPPPGADVDVPYHVGVGEFAGRIAILGLLDDVEGVAVGDAIETAAVAVGDALTYGFRRTS